MAAAALEVSQEAARSEGVPRGVSEEGEGPYPVAEVAVPVGVSLEEAWEAVALLGACLTEGAVEGVSH